MSRTAGPGIQGKETRVYLAASPHRLAVFMSCLYYGAAKADEIDNQFDIWRSAGELGSAGRHCRDDPRAPRSAPTNAFFARFRAAPCPRGARHVFRAVLPGAPGFAIW